MLWKKDQFILNITHGEFIKKLKYSQVKHKILEKDLSTRYRSSRAATITYNFGNINYKTKFNVLV